jgi:hypothetical protein
MPKNNKSNDDEHDPNFYDLDEVEEQKKVVKFIDDLIKNNVQKEKELQKKRLSDYNNLLAINSEWLDGFLIIGFDLNGDEVIISKTKTAKDYNSVLNLLKKAFINLVVKHEGE